MARRGRRFDTGSRLRRRNYRGAGNSSQPALQVSPFHSLGSSTSCLSGGADFCRRDGRLWLAFPQRECGARVLYALCETRQCNPCDTRESVTLDVFYFLASTSALVVEGPPEASQYCEQPLTARLSLESVTMVCKLLILPQKRQRPSLDTVRPCFAWVYVSSRSAARFAVEKRHSFPPGRPWGNCEGQPFLASVSFEIMHQFGECHRHAPAGITRSDARPSAAFVVAFGMGRASRRRRSGMRGLNDAVVGVYMY